MEFYEKLKYLRAREDYKQEVVADYLGITRSTISGYETKFHEPSQESLVRLAKLFKVSVDYLVNPEIEDVNYPFDNEGNNLSLKEARHELITTVAGMDAGECMRVVEYARYVRYVKEK